MKISHAVNALAVLSIAALSFSTSNVQAEPTRSASAIPPIMHKPPIGFSWDEFGMAGFVGGIAGAMEGALEGAVGWPVGIAVGAGVRAGVGTVAGLVGDLAGQAVQGAFGVTQPGNAVPAHALD